MSRVTVSETVGFGASTDFGTHLFRVEIPAARSGGVTITEDYGIRGGERGLPYSELRASIPREAWASIAETSRRHFNERLRFHKLPSCRWTVGATKLERLLGKELCVLAWAAEHTTSKDERVSVCARWLALRPEERWWLYAQTVAETGLAEDKNKGWRKALYFALAGGPVGNATGTRPKRPTEDAANETLSLFGQV